MKFAVLLTILVLPFAIAAEPRQLLQEGLFEEEANRDLDKASAAYESLIAAFDKERQYAATALFRLAEIRAKQNRKEEAVALFKRVATEFSSNEPLARLSRERIATLGGNLPAAPGGVPAISDKESQEIVRLQDLIKNSPDLLNTGKDGPSPLVRAASEGWMTAAALLLDHGAKVDVPRGKMSAIHAAASNGRKAMVELLIARGANLEAVDEFQRTPLQIASEFARFEVVRVLLERGADPNAKLSDGQNRQSPLHFACLHGNLAVVRLLLDKHADVNAMSESSNLGSSVVGSPLMVAARGDNLELVNLLLDRGAKPNLRAPEPLVASPLIAAVEANDIPIAERLLERGASINDPWLVFLAAKNNDSKMVRFLASKGADVSANLPEASHTTALHTAVTESLDMTKLLLELGASPKVTDAETFTPLHTVTCLYPLMGQPSITPEKERDLFSTIQLLVKHGAPMNAQTSEGATPLHFALAREVPTEVLNWLLANGADPDIKDKQGLIPTGYAHISKRLEFEQRTLFPRLAKQRAVHVAFLFDGQPIPPYRIDPLTEFDTPPTLMTVWQRALANLPPSSPSQGNFTNAMVLRANHDGKLAGVDRVEAGQQPITHAELQWGDVLVLGPGIAFPDRNASRPITITHTDERIKAAIRTVTIRVGDRETSVGLWGEPGTVTWAPSMGRIKEWKLSDLIAKVAAGEPHAQLGAVKIQRAVNGEMKEWLVDLRPEHPGQKVKELNARLANGDRLIIPLLKIDDPDALKARRSGIFRTAPGGVFGEQVFHLHEKDDAPRTLGELIAESYRNSLLVVPNPDFSNIRIRRLKADGSGEEMLVVDLSKGIESVSAKTTWKEAADLDVPLQWGDIVEILTVKDAKPSEWRGLAPQVKLFLTKALVREIQYRANNADFQTIQMAPTYADFRPNSQPYEFHWIMSPAPSSNFRALRNTAIVEKNQVRIRLTSRGKTREYTPEEFKAINPWLIDKDQIEVETF